MSWYSTGTISVTNGSAAVTGSGTAWVAAVRAGWAMIMPNGLPYEIASVNSDTGITLVNVYTGTTQTGQAYSVMPTQGLEANLVTALNDLLTNYQGVYDGVGQGKFLDGTVAAPGIRFAGDEDTGLYRPASNQLAAAAGGVMRWLLSSTAFTVNVPITGSAVQSSASDTTAGKLMAVGAFGLGGASVDVADLDTAPIGSIGSFGVTALNKPTPNGITNAAGTVFTQEWNGTTTTQIAHLIFPATHDNTLFTRMKNTDGWTEWERVFSTNNTVGTVSQSGGVPTGAIIERGSNANGEYVRFADGTQICTSVFDVTFKQTFALIKEWAFPAAFVTGSSGDLVFSFAQNEGASSTTPSPNSLVGYDIGAPTTSNVQVRLRRMTGGSDFVAGDIAKTTAIVMGRWF